MGRGGHTSRKSPRTACRLPHKPPPNPTHRGHQLLEGGRRLVILVPTAAVAEAAQQQPAVVALADVARGAPAEAEAAARPAAGQEEAGLMRRAVWGNQGSVVLIFDRRVDRRWGRDGRGQPSAQAFYPRRRRARRSNATATSIIKRRRLTHLEHLASTKRGSDLDRTRGRPLLVPVEVVGFGWVRLG